MSYNKRNTKRYTKQDFSENTKTSNKIVNFEDYNTNDSYEIENSKLIEQRLRREYEEKLNKANVIIESLTIKNEIKDKLINSTRQKEEKTQYEYEIILKRLNKVEKYNEDLKKKVSEKDSMIESVTDKLYESMKDKRVLTLEIVELEKEVNSLTIKESITQKAYEQLKKVESKSYVRAITAERKNENLKEIIIEKDNIINNGRSIVRSLSEEKIVLKSRIYDLERKVNDMTNNKRLRKHIGYNDNL